MAEINTRAWRCDVCSWVWIKKGPNRQKPVQCANPKCRSRKWDEKGIVQPLENLPQTSLEELEASRRSWARTSREMTIDEAKRRFPPVNTFAQGVENTPPGFPTPPDKMPDEKMSMDKTDKMDKMDKNVPEIMSAANGDFDPDPAGWYGPGGKFEPGEAMFFLVCKKRFHPTQADYWIECSLPEGHKSSCRFDGRRIDIYDDDDEERA